MRLLGCRNTLACTSALLLACRHGSSSAFVIGLQTFRPPAAPSALGRSRYGTTTTAIRGTGKSMDMVTYLRTEWIAAALFTNQCPRTAETVLQLGTDDGRAVSFIPRTVKTLITSSAAADGQLTVAARRQLKQQQERRKAAQIEYVDQASDELVQVKDASVDVVVSLGSAAKLIENGRDWKKSVCEAARVLKPGGRILFIEKMDLNGESYVDYIQRLASASGDLLDDNTEDDNYPIFNDVGFDEIDLVLEPHMAGVAIKDVDAGLTAEQRLRKVANVEKDTEADLSIEAYERGLKKRRRKKKSGKPSEETETAKV